MRRSSRAKTAAALLAIGISGCGSATAASGGGAAPGPETASPPVASAADIQFMTGMIHHHAQALVMAGMAATHGASEAIQTLSERITVSQKDEIALIQLWLSDHGLPVPEPSPNGMRMVAGGTEHDMLMPGMLTPEQIDELDRARGREFDRLFLAYMIQHHDGALMMVDELFATYGGGVDNFVYKFATDTFADQGSEIDRMQRILESMGSP